MSKNKALKPSYAAPDGFTIHAYSDAASRKKTEFLRDAKALLREAAAQVSTKWVSTTTVNKAGVAVGGDVYLKLISGDCPRIVHVCITGAMFGRESDGVVIYAQIRNKSGGILFGNFYLDASLDSKGLAAEFSKLIKDCEAQGA